jgi:5-methylcytosine-specific restriction endonuclease McrA
LRREEIDQYWNRYVGSHRLRPFEEVRILNELVSSGKCTRFVAYQMYLTSNHWKRLRLWRLAKDKFKCVKCGKRAEDNLLHVDHLRYGKRIGDERLDDLQSLCEGCHKLKTKMFSMDGGDEFAAVNGQMFMALQEVKGGKRK